MSFVYMMDGEWVPFRLDKKLQFFPIDIGLRGFFFFSRLSHV